METFSPRNENRRVPIEIILGRHVANNIASLSYLDAALTRSFAKKEGNVVVFLEEPNCPEPVATHIESEVRNGKSPSESCVTGQFFALHGRLPRKTDSQKLSSLISSITPWYQAELSILDTYHRQYPSRIKIAHEAIPVSESRKQSRLNPFDREAAMSFGAMQEGDFQTGVIHFINAVESMCSRVTSRDQRLAKKIEAAANEPDTVAVVGHIGAAHTLLSHILSRDGQAVSRTFTDAQNGRFVYGSMDEAIRRRQFTPDKPIPELSWYKYAVGYVLEYTIAEASKRFVQPPTQQDQMKIVRTCLKTFSTIDNMREFEIGVRFGGMYDQMKRRILAA